MGGRERKSFHFCLHGPSCTPAESKLGSYGKEYKEHCVSSVAPSSGGAQRRHEVETQGRNTILGGHMQESK